MVTPVLNVHPQESGIKDKMLVFVPLPGQVGILQRNNVSALLVYMALNALAVCPQDNGTNL